jgi:hypothetical protein
MNNEKTLDDLFAELDNDTNSMAEQWKREQEQRELEKAAYEALMKSKEPKPFILGQDKISIRTTSWCYDTCGRMTVDFNAVARDDDFVYFWHIDKVEWHQSEEGGIGHPNPFFKLPISKDNSNWCEESEFIWADESEWFEISHILLKNAVLPETEHFEYLFDYVNN